MKKIICFIVLLHLIINSEIFSQNYVDGYVLTNERDTLFGKIDNKSYHENALYCDFKSDKSDSSVRFFPDKIFGYRFTHGKYYVSKDVTLGNLSVRIFSEYLVHGKLDIYFYQDEGGNNHYFAAKDTLPLSELIYRKEIVERDGNDMLLEEKQYIGLLNFYTSDCQVMKDDILKLSQLNHKKLIFFAEKYHNLTCKDQKCTIYEKNLPKKMKFNVFGGPVYYRNSFKDDETSNFEYGFNVMFQYSQRSERIYLGVGFLKNDLEGILFNGQIPLSVNYMNPKAGFSPVFAYEMDLNYLFMLQNIRAGVKYQINKTAFFLAGDIKTVFLVIPGAVGLKFGMSFDLR